jgi:hypothetical protein
MSLMINKIASMRSQLADQQFGSFVLRKASVGVSPFTATLLGKIASGVKISSIEKLAFSYKDLPAQARNGIFIVSAYTTKVKDNIEKVTVIPEDEWFRNLLNGTYVYEEGVANRLKDETPDEDDPSVEYSTLKTVSLTPALLDKQFGVSAWHSVSAVLSHTLKGLGLSSALTSALIDMVLSEIKTEFLASKHSNTFDLDSYVSDIKAEFMSSKTVRSFDNACLTRIVGSSFWKSNIKKYPELGNQAQMASVLRQFVVQMRSINFTQLVGHSFYSVVPDEMKYKREGRATNKAKVTTAMQLFNLFHKYGLDMNKMETLTASPWQAGAVGEQSFMFLQEVDFHLALFLNNLLKQDAFIWGIPNKGYPVMMYSPKDHQAHMPAGVKLVGEKELSHEIETAQSVSTNPARKDFLQVDGGSHKQLAHMAGVYEGLLEPSVVLTKLKQMLPKLKVSATYHNNKYEEHNTLPNFDKIVGTLPQKEYHEYMMLKFGALGGENTLGRSYHEWLGSQVENDPKHIDISIVPTMKPDGHGGWIPSTTEADHLRIGAINGGAFEAYHYLMNVKPGYTYRLVEKKYSVGVGGSFGLNLYQTGSTKHPFAGEPLDFDTVNGQREEMGHLPFSKHF